MGLFDKLADKAKDLVEDGGVDKVLDAVTDNLDDVVAKIPADKRNEFNKLLEKGEKSAAIEKVCDFTGLGKDKAKDLVDKLQELLK